MTLKMAIIPLFYRACLEANSQKKSDKKSFAVKKPRILRVSQHGRVYGLCGRQLHN